MLRGFIFLSCLTLTFQVILSSKSPKDLGYQYAERSPNHRPPQSSICLSKPQPIQTNTWWVPAISPVSSDGNPRRRITPIPYVYTMQESSFRISYPFMLTSPDIINSIIDPPDNDWVISSIPAPTRFCLQRGEKLSASFIYKNQLSDLIQVNVVRGSQYITMNYLGAIPDISTNQKVSRLLVDGKVTKCDGESTISGHKFALQLADTDTEWFVWFPKGTNVQCTSPARLQVVSDKFFGIVRLSMASNCSTGEKSPKTGALSPHCSGHGPHKNLDAFWSALDSSSNVCVTGADVSLSSNTSTLSNTITWRTEECWPGQSSGGQALIMGLPHHVAQLQQSNIKLLSVGGHRNINGYNMPVIGNRWTLVLPRKPIQWLGVPDPDKVSQIRESLKAESGFDVPYECSEGIMDPYNAGKLTSRMAMLALIANQLKETEISTKLISKLKPSINLWLELHSQDLLIYDPNWGGIITCGCTYANYPPPARCENRAKSKLDCPALSDFNSEFGNAFYNDHHFHYGYLIYTAAVVSYLDKNWAAAFKERVLMLIRDIANPSDADPYFPMLRHFDWYVGHSWAQGIVSNPNGLNQESGSEAVNAYYGIYLYGLATHNEVLMTHAEAMIMSEIASIRTYWQVSKQVYPSGYQHDLVGIVWDRLIEYHTFFGRQPFFVYGIQLIPVTPMVPLMLSGPWLNNAFPAFLRSCREDDPPLCEDSGFITFVYAAQALIDKKAAWKNALQLSNAAYRVDCAGCNGNSRTNLLHFVASSGNSANFISKAAADKGVLFVGGLLIVATVCILILLGSTGRLFLRRDGYSSV